MFRNPSLNLELIEEYPDGIKSCKSHIFFSFNGKGIQIINKKLFDNIGKVFHFEIGEVKAIQSREGKVLITEEKSLFHFEEGKLKKGLNINQGFDKVVTNKDGTLVAFDVNNLYTVDYQRDGWFNIYSLEDGQFNSLSLDNNKVPYVSGTSGSYLIREKDNAFYLEQIKLPLDNSENVNHEELCFYQNGNVLFAKNGVSLVFCNEDSCKTISGGSFINSLKKSRYKDLIYACSKNGVRIINNKGEIQDEFFWNLNIIGKDVYRIIEDEFYYYVLSQNGLFKIGKTEEFIYKFNEAFSSEFKTSISSGLEIDNDGYIYVSSSKGLIRLHPDSVDYSLELPNLIVKEFLVNNAAKKPHKNLYDSCYYKLSHSENNISIRAMVADLTDFNEAKVMVKLFSDSLISQSVTINNETVEYNSLTPGKYMIELLGINSNALKTNSKKIYITIRRPFYQTWWFLALVAISLIALGYLINYISSRRKLLAAQRELNRQKELSAQRESIADDLHDELGTELNRILYLSDEALHTEEGAHKEEILENITKLASGSIKNMRDMLWVLDDSNDSLESLLTRINYSIKQTLGDFHINYYPDIAQGLTDVRVNGEVRKHMLLLFKEATNNIIKHANASTVKFEAAYLNHLLQISLQDDGLGFQIDNIDKGYGLNSMKKRAKILKAKIEIQSSPKNGTLVKIEIRIKL